MTSHSQKRLLAGTDIVNRTFGANVMAGKCRSWCSCATIVFILLTFLTNAGFAQGFNINSLAITNGAMEIGFPGDVDSYYLLLSGPSVDSLASPTSAMLGTTGNLSFAPVLNKSGAQFFRVEQLPLTATNDILGDGIADGFKLEHGLPVFGPSEATVLPLGDTRSWLQIYEAQTNSAALPLAYFPNSSTNVVAGSSAATVRVQFTKPFTGRLAYQLSGTAIPSSSGVTGDYVNPAGNIFVNNSTSANIVINLVPEPDVEVNRSIIVAIAMPPNNQAYTITTNSSVTTVQIVQSQFGQFVGSLMITNGLQFGAQSVKMVFRPGADGNTVALLDVTGNAMLGDTFSVPAQVGASGFQLSGGQFSNVVSTPWGSNCALALSFGTTQTNGTVFTTPVTLSLSGLTGSGTIYSGFGILTLAQSQ